MAKFLNQEHERAYNLMLSNELEKALAIYDNLIYLFNDEPDLYADRGVIYLHKKNKELSFNDLEKALSLQPNYGFRYAARAYAKDFFGDTEGAIEDYERAVQLDPEDAVSYNNLGLLLEKLGNKKKAERHFKQADELSKSNLEFETYEGKEKTVNEQQIVTQKNSSVKEVKTSIPREMIKVLTSKKEFKAFLKFIFNGGKLEK